MVKKITKLTKKQEEMMPRYRDKWIEIGLKTGETDWKTFDKNMPICYHKAGLVYPKNVVRVSSPLVGALAASVANAIWSKKSGAVDDAVRDAVHGAVRGAVRGAVHGAVGDAVGGAVDGAVHGAVHGAVDGAVYDAVGGAVRGAVDGAVRDAVHGAVGDAVRDAVDGAVHGAVHGAVDGAVRDAVHGAVGDAVKLAIKNKIALSWHYWLGGQFWVGGWYWGVAFVNFFFDVCKLKLSKDIMERAKAYRKVCESVNYIWANKDFVMVCARPVHIDRDSQGRLHSENRMAIQYPDGWGLYMIHGVRVTEAIVLQPETLTKKDWMDESNLEVRRIIQDRMPDFAKKIGGKKIAEDSYGELIEVELPGDPEKIARYVKVKDSSTSRVYYLRVPPTIKTCKEGVSWSFELNEDTYNPVVET